jgi:hypothetical protein
VQEIKQGLLMSFKGIILEVNSNTIKEVKYRRNGASWILTTFKKNSCIQTLAFL